MGFWERFKRAAEAFRQEEKKAVMMVERIPEEVIKEQIKKRRPFNPLSDREVVFHVIEKNFLQTPCSFQEIYDVCSMLTPPLRREQISNALDGLCRNDWLTRVGSRKGARYFLEESQVKRRREEEKKDKGSASYPFSLRLSNEFQKIMKPLLCERTFGGSGFRADLSDLLIEQLAHQEPLSSIELKTVRNLMTKSKTVECYAPIPKSLYKKVKKIADDAGYPLTMAVLCFVLRWDKHQKKEQKEKLSAKEQNKQPRQTVAYMLRMGICKDLGKFCQNVGLNSNKYRYWEQGQEAYWTLSLSEQEKLAKYLKTSVEKIATPDGRPVFLYE